MTRSGVYYGRMLSPIGRNASFCFSRYGVTKDFVRRPSYVRPFGVLSLLMLFYRALFT